MLKVVETARQHGGARHQHDRKRRLYHQQCLARERCRVTRAAAGATQCLHRMCVGSEPRRRRSEDHARNQRQSKRKPQNRQRRSRADGQEMRAVEGQSQQQTRGACRDGQACNAAHYREQHAFRQRLRNDLPARRANGHAHCRLAAPRHPPRQQQVGHVRASDQQHQATHSKKDLQAAPVLLFHLGYARARRNHGDVLVRQQALQFGHPVGRIAAVIQKPLPQDSRQPGRQSRNARAGAQPANHPQPRRNRLPQERAFAVDQRLLLQGNPDVRRIAAQCFAKKTRRRDAGDRERMSFNYVRRTHHRRITAIRSLPHVIAQHGNRRCRCLIVSLGKQPPPKRTYAEGRKIAAGNELAAQRMGRMLRLTPHAHAIRPGLERGDLFKFRQVRLQALVERERVHSPAILGPPFHAAVVTVAHAVEAAGIGHRQGAQHDCVD